MNTPISQITQTDIDQLVIDTDTSNLELLSLVIKIALFSITNDSTPITDIKEANITDFSLFKEILRFNNDSLELDQKVQNHIDWTLKLIESIIENHTPESRNEETAHKLMKEYSEKDDKENFKKTYKLFIDFLVDSWCKEEKAKLFAESEINNEKLTNIDWYHLRAIFIAENNKQDMIETDVGYHLSNTEKIQLFMADLKIAKEKYGFEMNNIIPNPPKLKYVLLNLYSLKDIISESTPNCIRLAIQLAWENDLDRAIKNKNTIKTKYDLLSPKEKSNTLIIGKKLRWWMNPRKRTNMPMEIKTFLKNFNEFYEMKNRKKVQIDLKEYIIQRSENLFEELYLLINSIAENKTTWTLFLNLELNGITLKSVE